MIPFIIREMRHETWLHNLNDPYIQIPPYRFFYLHQWKWPFFLTFHLDIGMLSIPLDGFLRGTEYSVVIVLDVTLNK